MQELGVHAGIDVGASSLSVCVLGKKIFQKEYKNEAQGHEAIIKRFQSLNVTHICLEPTGSYSLDIAIALQTAGFAVMVANPRAVHHFAQALMQRSKTDPLDAQCLAEFGARMPFKSWVPPHQECLELRAIARRITSLKDTLVQEKNRLHSVSVTQTASICVTEDIEKNITYLKERVSLLEKEALCVIARDKKLQQQYELLLSVPGIGQASALCLLAELSVLPADMEIRQWVAHAGLDPRHKSSGTSVNGKVRISKTGNARIRKALFLPALTAVRYVDVIKTRMNQLKTKGNNPLAGLQAVVAIMRKMLHAIFGMFKTLTPFDIKKVFQTAC